MSAPQHAEGLVVMLDAAGRTIARLEAENTALRAANEQMAAALHAADAALADQPDEDPEGARHRAHPPSS